MTEEVKQETTEQSQEISPIEQRALDLGWRPKEEWDGPEEDFIDAKEFVRRQPLFEKIEQTTKALKELKKGHEALVQHHIRVKETEYQRALETLKNQRKQALRDGEGDLVVAIEERMELLDEQKKEAVDTLKQEAAQSQDALPEEAQKWVSRNSWYETDRAMKAVADSIASEYRRKVMAGEMTPADVLTLMEREVRKEFPHKFRTPVTSKAGAVEAPARGSRNASASLTDGMSEQDLTIMNKILRVTPSMKKEDYVKEWKRINGVA